MSSAKPIIDLSGRVALVTGSSRGIGRASALRFAEQGADIVVNYATSKAAATEVAAEIRALGRRAAVVKADVSERDDVTAMMEFVAEEFGHLDIVVSNAAGGGFRPLVEATDRHFEAAMNTNARALMLLVQTALPLLRNRPHRAKVISLSSHGSHMALPLYGTIGASKAAIEALSRQFALELGNEGINFNVVLAGVVETDSTRRLPGAEQIFESVRHKMMVSGRSLLPTDVANVVLFLASDLSDLIQGATVIVDGGEWIRP